jgi:predicted small metal-binding protein
MPLKEVTCMCGWRCRGTEDEVVEQVIAHGREAHQLETTREEVLALAVDAIDGPPSTAAPA